MSVIPDKLQKSVIIDIFRRIYSRWLFYTAYKRGRGIHMSNEDYKQGIIARISKSNNGELLELIYRFVKKLLD